MHKASDADEKHFRPCTVLWHNVALPLHKKQKNYNAMRNTEYDLAALATMISSESSFTALMEMMGDMGLEFEGAVRNA